jgi:WD40 repeat protein
MTDNLPDIQPPTPGPPEVPKKQPGQPRANPYVGPRALREGELIFGRDRELRELLNRMIADRMVLLYSPSGAGKSSLVQAGLVPRMRKEKFAVLPTVRVSLEPPDKAYSQSQSTQVADREPGTFNRYMYSALLALEQDLPPEQQQDPSDLVGLTLHDYLARRPRGPDEPSSRLLIFDQFEEILTFAPLDREGKLAFFNVLGEALLDHDLWALFIIREDFLAGLDPYLPLIPTYLRSTFRLDLLESQPALLAIQKPVDSQGITFTDEAAQKLVDDLRKVWVQQPDGSQYEEPGLYVEPVQLQVVCRRLYKELGLDQDLDKLSITEADIARLGDVNKALGEYYGSELSEIAEQKGVAERDIRDWFSEHLITENLLRGQVLLGEGSSEGMNNEVIRLLEDAHLVRAESRRNATWFELAHDRLVRPILEDNQEWAETHLQDFQRRAAEWRKKNWPTTMLLRGRDLVRAEEWTRSNPIEINDIDWALIEASRELRTRNLNLTQRKAAEWIKQGRPAALLLGEAELAQAESWLKEQPDEAAPSEVDYVSASREAVLKETRLRQERELQLDFERQRARDQELQNQKLRRRNIWLAAVASLATLVFLVALYYAYQFNTLAATNAARAGEQSTLAAKNATQAEDNARGAKSIASERDLIAAQAATLEWENVLSQQTAKALRATSAALATESELNLQGRATAEFNASFAQAGRLASLSRENSGKDPPLSVLLGIAAYQEYPQIWDRLDVLLSSLQANTQQEVRVFGAPIETQIRTVQSIAFNQDGRLLAWSGLDGKLRVWDLDHDQLLRELQKFPEHGVNSLAFSPVNSKLLIGGSGNGYLTFWNLETGEGVSVEAIYRSPENMRYTAGLLLGLAFSPDGNLLAVAGLNGNVQIWDVAQRVPVSAIDTGSVTVRKLAWSPDGTRLAGAAYDSKGGVVYIWNPSNGEYLDRLPSDDELVYSLDWSPDGNWLAYAGGGVNNPFYQRKIALYKTSTRQQFDIAGQNYNIRTLAFDQKSKILAAGSDDGTLNIWDISQAGNNGTVTLIDLPINNFITRPPVQGLTFSHQGPNRLAYLTNDSRVVLIEFGLTDPLKSVIEPGSISQYVRVFPNLTCDQPLGLQANPVSGLLAVGQGNHREILRLNQQSGTLFVNALGSGFQASLRSSDILNAALGPNSLVATGDQTGKIQVWDAQTGAVIWETETNEPVISLAISQNGKQLAAAYASAWCESISQHKYAIGLYEIGTQRPAIGFQSKSEIHSLAFSAHGDFLAGGDSEGRIQLWEIRTQNLLEKEFTWVQAGTITSLAISPDSSILASGNQMGNIALWDINSRRQIGQDIRKGEASGTAPVTGLLFTPDGLGLVSATQDGGLQRWELDMQSWIQYLCKLAGRDFTPAEVESLGVKPVCTKYLPQATATPGP